jgi:phosphatidylserine/phosphatidylglycerophosphate/cardiolipin synthase-like enzyme
MQTEAVFESIGNRIEKELQQAKSTIFIAVAWFTNKRLFSSLVEKAANGCAVNLITTNDRINESSQIDFNDVNKGKLKVYKIGNGDTELMHNKFCVIDYDTVIAGSYNWSYKAESNHENIIITKGDSSLAWQFINEFNSLRKRYYPTEPTPYEVLPLAKIIHRLEILKNYVSLEDSLEKQRLKEYQFHPDIAEIIQLIEEKELAGAINKIQSFIYQNQQLTIWIEPELAALKLEVKNLENQLNAYDNEKADLEKVLALLGWQTLPLFFNNT